MQQLLANAHAGVLLRLKGIQHHSQRPPELALIDAGAYAPHHTFHYVLIDVWALLTVTTPVPALSYSLQS
eukprot:scaffold202881_cov21-Tisochrysis_lutea.AAC.2